MTRTNEAGEMRVADAPGTPAAEAQPVYPHTMRLQRFLARAGVASRRGSEDLMTAGRVTVSSGTFALIRSGGMKKGDVLATAQIAGIMAAKHTPDIIPMCHPLLITKSKCDIVPIAPAGTPAEDVPEGWAPARADGQVGFHVLVTAGVTGKTGIEMEALTGASAACLTIYDM